MDFFLTVGSQQPDFPVTGLWNLTAGCSIYCDASTASAPWAVTLAKDLATTPVLTLRTVIEECLKSKKKARKRPATIRNLRFYFNNFAQGRETMDFCQIKFELVKSWWDARNEKDDTGLYRLSSLFSFGVMRGYIENNPCWRIEKMTVERKDVAVFDPATSEKSLHFTRQKMPRFLRWLTLATFCGTRPEETDQIDDSMIELKNCRLNLPASITKDRDPRIVPICPAAMEWLKLGGDLPLPLTTRRRYIRRLRNHLGIKAWPKDVLRHTAASMMLAREENAARVALWLGNSPKILLRRYYKPPPPEAVGVFWAIVPFKRLSQLQKPGDDCNG